MTKIWPYHHRDYDSKERFCSYWHQINEALIVNLKEILEIGKGNGFVSNYLRNRGMNVITLDMDKRLDPDIVGSVLELPLPDESFDVVMCCEVLEHLPYEDFRRALAEMFRVSRRHAILSLPDTDRVCRLNVQLPGIGEIKTLIRLPRLRKPVGNFSNASPSGIDAVGYSIQHYWEIGGIDCPLNKIMKDIQSAGFEVKKSYRVFEHPHHRFFVLAKGKAKSEPNRKHEI